MLKTKEELLYEYWIGKKLQNDRKRMQRQIAKLEADKMHRPERTIGIVNEDGQLEVVIAKELSQEVKLLPEVAVIIIGFGYIFAQLEIHVGSML
jgi:hypothetical protein